VPFGLGPHLDGGEASVAQQWRPVDADPARQSGVVRGLGLPVGQDQRPSAPEYPVCLGGGSGRVCCEMESVDGHGGIGAGFRKPGISEITDDEPCPSGQPEHCCPECGLSYCDGGEIYSHQGSTGLSGEPQAGPAPSASQVGQHLSWREVQGRRHVAQQAGRDKGEGFDLGRQVRLGELPDPPNSGGCRCR
jgi:hypothetical protein